MNLTGNDASDLARAGFTMADADRFRDILENTYGVGGVGDGTAPEQSNPNVNIFGKLNWQLTGLGQVELSFNHVDANKDILLRLPTSTTVPGRLRDGYELSNSGYLFDNVTNTARAKWTADFGKGFSNEFLAGFSAIRDKRELGSSAPLILARAGAGRHGRRMAGGRRRAVLAAQLTRPEHLLDSGQPLVRHRRAPLYASAPPTSSTASTTPSSRRRSACGPSTASTASRRELPAAFERVLPTAARPEGPIANFKVQQLGLYAQDEWSPTDRLTLTAGLRMDVPFNDKPVQNPALAANPFLPINTAEFPSGNMLWSPRLGFNFDPFGTGRTILRGGAGYFTGRPPYVWLSNAFVNTGLEQVTLTCTGATVPAFTADPASQPTTCAGGGAATAPRPSPNYFVKDFKFPQTFRVSLGVDHRLPGGFVGTIDLLYSKNVNQLYVQDANLSGNRRQLRRPLHVRCHRHERHRRVRGDTQPHRAGQRAGRDRQRGAAHQLPPSAAPTRNDADSEELRQRLRAQRRLYPLEHQGRRFRSPAARRSPTSSSRRWTARSSSRET